jgi:hypothetical protein
VLGRVGLLGGRLRGTALGALGLQPGAVVAAVDRVRATALEARGLAVLDGLRPGGATAAGAGGLVARRLAGGTALGRGQTSLAAGGDGGAVLRLRVLDLVGDRLGGLDRGGVVGHRGVLVRLRVLHLVGQLLGVFGGLVSHLDS